MPVETIASIAPDASADAILRAANWPKSNKNVIVVGHQPTLGMVAGQLINGVDGVGGYVSVKKAAVWWFRMSERGGAPKTVLVAMATPDTVAD